MFVPRVTTGSLPSLFATTACELAEERRLLYLAITRARVVLELSSAGERGGGCRRLTLSAFLAAVRPSGRRLRVAPPVACAVFATSQRVTHDVHGMGVAIALGIGSMRVNSARRPTHGEGLTAKLQAL